MVYIKLQSLLLHPTMEQNSYEMSQTTTTKKPSYIDYMNSFWRQDENEQFSAVQSRLYYLLLYIFNGRKWVDQVSLSDHYLCDMMGVSLNTLRTAKRDLSNRGVIAFSAGGRGFANKTKYQLRYQAREQSSGQSTYQSRGQNMATSIYKETKEIKTKEKFNKKWNSNGSTNRGTNYTESDFD